MVDKDVIIPAWTKRVVDAEVAVLIAQEIEQRRADYPCEVEDSRFLEGVTMDLIEIFMERHDNDDEDYWHSHEFLDSVFQFVGEFMRAWKADPQWINVGCRYAYDKGMSTKEFIENPKPMPAPEDKVSEMLEAFHHLSMTWDVEQFMVNVYEQKPGKDPGYTKEKWDLFQRNPLKFWYAQLDSANRRRVSRQILKMVQRDELRKATEGEI